MAKGIRRDLNKARDAVTKEMRAISAKGSLYARGLSTEGYAGGYRDALDDVSMALDGIWNQNSRFWPRPTPREDD